jgi:uracil-DNA glycosylase family 4
MFVGEAPGENEAKEGAPFVGRSGDILRSLIAEAGVSSYALANTICCRPPFNDYELAVKANAPLACGPHLSLALNATRAWIVIAVGGKAAAEFGWHGSVSAAVGKWRWSAGRLHTTIWHPSYLLRRGGLSSKEGRHNLEVLREANLASQGVGHYTPDAPYTSQTASSIGSDGAVDMVRSALALSGYVPIHSRVLDANVVLYDPERIEPLSSIKLPPGFGEPLYFTINELARLKHPDDVRRVAALKRVLPNVVVVA